MHRLPSHSQLCRACRIGSHWNNIGCTLVAAADLRRRTEPANKARSHSCPWSTCVPGTSTGATTDQNPIRLSISLRHWRLMPVKAVFFDLDDTLLLTTQLDEEALRDVERLLAEAQPELQWDQVHGAWQDAFKQQPWDTTHQVSVEEWRADLWHKALVSHGVDDAELATRMQREFTRSRVSRFIWEPRVQELVADVKSRGYEVVIITNGHPEVQRSKLEACKAAEAVTHILIGGDEVAAGRHEKPHPSIFHKACELAECQPNEALHIGDSLSSDIKGGMNAGLAATVWVNPLGLPLPQDAPQPTHIVKHVTEVLHLLDQIAEES